MGKYGRNGPINMDFSYKIQPFNQSYVNLCVVAVHRKR